MKIQKILLLSLVLLLCFFTSLQAEAKTRNYSGEQASNALTNLEWAYWNKEGGKNDGKYIYAVARPGCPRCKAFAQKTSSIAKNYEIRWIFIDDYNVDTYGYVVSEQMPKSYADYHAGRKVKNSEYEKFLFEYNGMSLSNATQILNIKSYNFPLIFIPTQNGLKVLETYDVNVVNKELKTTAMSKDNGLIAKIYLEETFANQTNTIKPYFNENIEDQAFYMLPTKLAPVLVGSQLEPGTGYNKALEYNEDWVKAPAFSSMKYWQPYLFTK